MILLRNKEEYEELLRDPQFLRNPNGMNSDTLPFEGFYPVSDKVIGVFLEVEGYVPVLFSHEYQAVRDIEEAEARTRVLKEANLVREYLGLPQLRKKGTNNKGGTQ